LTGAAYCVPIKDGYYINSAHEEVFCGTNASTQHYIGGGYSNKTCRCGEGYVGDSCDIPVCLNNTRSVGGSLGTLLFYGDSTLNQASKDMTSGLIDIAALEAYLFHLLSVNIDVAGDGTITFQEMLNYLDSRSIYTQGIENLPLWCSAPSSCQYSEYPVVTLFEEALNLFMTSPKHKFDGSGSELVVDLASTFPTPLWNDSICRRYDSSYRGYAHVETSWKFTQISGYTIVQVCGYVNGQLNSEFTTTRLLKGEQTSFVDNSPIQPTNSFKRVYCVLVFYKVDYVIKKAYECSVGLLYVSSLEI
jgi:hypothetical protein